MFVALGTLATCSERNRNEGSEAQTEQRQRERCFTVTRAQPGDGAWSKHHTTLSVSGKLHGCCILRRIGDHGSEDLLLRLASSRRLRRHLRKMYELFLRRERVLPGITCIAAGRLNMGTLAAAAMAVTGSDSMRPIASGRTGKRHVRSDFWLGLKAAGVGVLEFGGGGALDLGVGDLVASLVPLSFGAGWYVLGQTMMPGQRTVSRESSARSLSMV